MSKTALSTVIITILGLLFRMESGSAITIRVPAQYPDIQAGINASYDGDTVLVAPGTYTGEGNYDISFSGREIVLISEAGAEATIIDALRMGRGIIFNTGEDESSVLEGFTIRLGYNETEYYGGGIYCSYSSPTIRNNIISQSYAYYGGGIGLYHSSPMIENNIIEDNTGNRGGGIAVYYNCYPLIRNNIIRDNYSEGD
ncbi:right-handed parallel beta-helix repeat-containing protein [bacterium]|nr:right-handed parallel beta-helix repeat-containing protein [FCB group bacterium]MBL7190489.1 right-handed parallel beta-helix repeat-containing protein [bacterium]